MAEKATGLLVRHSPRAQSARSEHNHIVLVLNLRVISCCGSLRCRRLVDVPHQAVDVGQRLVGRQTALSGRVHLEAREQDADVNCGWLRVYWMLAQLEDVLQAEHGVVGGRQRVEAEQMHVQRQRRRHLAGLCGAVSRPRLDGCDGSTEQRHRGVLVQQGQAAVQEGVLLVVVQNEPDVGCDVRHVVKHLTHTVAIVLKAAAVQHQLNEAVGIGTAAVGVGAGQGELVVAVVVKQKGTLHSWEVVAGDGLVLDQLNGTILKQMSHNAKL